MLLRALIVLLAALPLLLAAPILWDRLTPQPPPATTRPATGPAFYSDARPILGFSVVAHHIGDLPLYLRSVDRIADLGANALIVVTPMFQKKVDSNTIAWRADRCPRAEQLAAIFGRARERGLLTCLQPIVLLEEPGEHDWRGVLAPSDRDAWWASYRLFVEYFLDVAVTAEVDLFTVGSELNSTEDDFERWQEIVERVRSRFDGQITYSANWDRYERVDLWPLVDVMSVSSYFELQPGDPDAPVDALVRDWRLARDRLLGAAERWDKPLLLSEIGYPSLPWASAHPWNYVARGTRADHHAQARGYRAFFRAWTPVLSDPAGRALGFHCYHWDPYHHGQDTDTGYGVVGKPAYEVVREGFRGILAETARRAPAASRPAPARTRPDQTGPAG